MNVVEAAHKLLECFDKEKPEDLKNCTIYVFQFKNGDKISIRVDAKEKE